MASPLPLRPAVSHSPRSTAVLDITDERSEAVFGALGSETARSIFAALDEEPGTASDLADRVGTSLQNVQYHLGRLSEADLIAPIDTWYSVKGREMNVYAVTAEELVVRTGPTGEPSPASAASRGLADPPEPAGD